MKIIAFGASNGSKSINKSLAGFAASLIAGADLEVLDLNDFELPLFSEDKEAEIGQPQAAKRFVEKIRSADGIVVSFAEHNGSYTAAYKNLFDWASRIEQKVYQDKPAVFLATSPGAGGASSVLSGAKASAPFFGADLQDAVSVPSYYDVFDAERGVISEPKIVEQLQVAMDALAAKSGGVK
tara:strand:+ start:1767 stop:2312 length:546 start_codon:yes stop_codon:yes gene_type:complete